jgi:hypothetical protein
VSERRAETPEVLLRRYEWLALSLFLGCLSLFVTESGVDAYSGPNTLGQALLDWPKNVLLTLLAGCAAAAVPLMLFRPGGTLRIGAFIVLCGSIGWAGWQLVFLAVYMIAMSGFD